MAEKYTFGTLGVVVSPEDIVNLLTIINDYNLKRKSDNLNHPRVQRRILVNAYEAGWRPQDWSIGEPEMPLYSNFRERGIAISEQENFLKDLLTLKAISREDYEVCLFEVRERLKRLNSGK